MSVLVKGMRMPSYCKYCQFEKYQLSTGQTWCVAKMEILAIQGHKVSSEYKPKWCPLVDVPVPHGDLIDRDACIDYCRDSDQRSWEALAYEQPVIEAEGEGSSLS